VESELVADAAVASVWALIATKTGCASVANVKVLPPPPELCTQLCLLLPVPAEVMKRSIHWSVDWQPAGRVILFRQLVGRVTLAEMCAGGVPQSRVTLACLLPGSTLVV
jgi:hypothetical protein